MVDIMKLEGKEYVGASAKLMANKLAAVNSLFKEGIQEWLDSGKETDYVIHDMHLKDLQSKFNLTYPAAILSMDWLLREPEKAIASFNRGIK